MRIETVHRLTDSGRLSPTSRGTSQNGFDAEWRRTQHSDGRRRPVSRCEIFDEADLDAALARFDELGGASS